MRRIVALDLSVKSTGFALWETGWAKPMCGIWELAPGIEYASRAYVRLQRNLMDLHRVGALTNIVFEEPISPASLTGHTNVETVWAAAGLAAHAMSFAEAVGARWSAANLTKWRRHFIGKMKRGTKTPDLKHFAMMRCRQLGFDPPKHDAAEACGILDYELYCLHEDRPWADSEIFAPELPARPTRRLASPPALFGGASE